MHILKLRAVRTDKSLAGDVPNIRVMIETPQSGAYHLCYWFYAVPKKNMVSLSSNEQRRNQASIRSQCQGFLKLEDDVGLDTHRRDPLVDLKIHWKKCLRRF